jgi:hypothetical protein
MIVREPQGSGSKW